MTNVLRVIFDAAIWVFVPLILVLIIRYANSVSKKADEEKHRSAARAGFWAGFILFVMVLIYQVGIFVQSGFPDNELYQGFNIPVAIAAGIIGFVVVTGGKKVLPAQLSGWIVLIITFASFYALLHYLFIRTYNEMLLSLILGLTFGALAHAAASPSSLREFLSSR